MIHYATFGQRFFAALVDGFLMVPIVLGATLLAPDAIWPAMLLTSGAMLAIVFYPILCHAEFGKTIGKHLMGIRVVTLDGGRIGWKHAWLRSSVDVGFAVLSIVIMGIEFSRAAVQEADTVFVTTEFDVGTLTTWLDWAWWLWAASEVVVMLFNEQRRALHDFIAGTLVVQ